MEITLFNLSRTLSSDGSRLISAILRQAGHPTKSIFLARASSSLYETDELSQLHYILQDSEIVMIAVYSSYVQRAIHLTEFIHDNYAGLKVIWGGPHCISAPEVSLKYADGICFSEGDQAALELVNRIEAKADYTDTPNMAFNKDGSFLINRTLPPFTDLDNLPYYDYDLEEQYLLDGGLSPMTKEIVRKRHAYYPYNMPTFYYLTSRGCPNRCAYCNNSRYIELFGHNAIRFISVDRIINELDHTLKHLDFFEILSFGDDDFLMRPQSQIEEFAIKYKKRIDLPFLIGASANTYRKEKMEILLDSGLKCIQMGVQSGSQRIIDEVFTRKVTVKKTKEAVEEIVPYKKRKDLDLLLDFIIDNPYETPEDVIQTYNYLLNLPLDVIVNIFFLAFFPGTPIYDRALKDGHIEPYQETKTTFKFSTREGIRVRYQQNYEMFLILLLKRLRLHCLDNKSTWRRYIPKSFFRLVGSYPIRRIAALFPRSFYSFLCQKIQ
ncbi:B12-binding domain-containing radical SAM protein [Thermodesulfobacteriota bacterium]